MQWFGMGGYSVYIWSAYGVALFLLSANLIACFRQKKQVQKKLKQWFTSQTL